MGTLRNESGTPFIPWEHDLDLCVFEKDRSRVAATLAASEELGFETFPKEHTWIVGRLHGSHVIANYAENWVDVYMSYPSSDKIALSSQSGDYFLDDELFPFRSISYCGAHMNFPAVGVPYLARYYGDDWKTPRHDTLVRRLRCSLTQWF